MPKPPPEEPLTRFQAQRKLGLFAPHDYLSTGFLFLSWVGWAVALGLACPWRIIAAWAAFNVVLAQLLIIVLAYRVLVFILDLHSEVALMPEAAARIVIGHAQQQAHGGA